MVVLKLEFQRRDVFYKRPLVRPLDLATLLFVVLLNEMGMKIPLSTFKGPRLRWEQTI